MYASCIIFLVFIDKITVKHHTYIHDPEVHTHVRHGCFRIRDSKARIRACVPIYSFNERLVPCNMILIQYTGNFSVWTCLVKNFLHKPFSYKDKFCFTRFPAGNKLDEMCQTSVRRHSRSGCVAKTNIPWPWPWPWSVLILRSCTPGAEKKINQPWPWPWPWHCTGVVDLLETHIWCFAGAILFGKRRVGQHLANMVTVTVFLLCDTDNRHALLRAGVWSVPEVGKIE